MISTSFTKAISLTANQYLENTTLSGFKFLIKLTEFRVQKCIWWSVLIANFSFSLYVVLYAWSSFTSNPTITTLESQEYPIWNVPFPAVGICNVNKFSLKAVQEYVQELSKKTHNGYSEEQLMTKMLLLGSLYDISSTNHDDAIDFQDLLDFYDSSKVDGYYDIRSVMERWQGEDRACNELFTLEATPDGFCCTFNYERFKYKYAQVDKLRTNYTGASRGLVVLLNGTTIDYFYNNHNTLGFTMQIFAPGNFPDGTTGSLREYIINPSKEIYVKLQVTTLNSKDTIKPYGVNQRKCLFKDERSAEYGEHYSYPECLTKCKLRSILALCNCIPFYAPSDFKEESTTSIYCTLAHSKCLERYRVTWNTYRPQGAGVEGFEREQEDSLSCPDCFPLCSNTVYNFETTSAAIQAIGSTRTSWGLLKGIYNLKDVCLLRIYFGSTASVLYKTDVLYTWYEILGNFGGLLGLCLGFSIISLMEFIYFITIKFYENKTTIHKQPQHRRNNRKRRFPAVNLLKNFNRKSKNNTTQFVYVN